MTTRTPLDICIATCDIVGPVRNGGIGTAYYSLARLLADAGHRVTVLYTLGSYCEQQSLAHWQEVYRALGITLVPVPAADDVRGHTSLRMSVATYRWLRAHRFDVVHFHEWRGIAFYALLAKTQGLAFDGTTFCVGVHSPTLWLREGMGELATAEDLEVDFMERESVALADVLWSPSQHMLDWMAREGWRPPRRTVLRPYVVLDADRTAAAPSTRVQEIVFFGRLETRKGLDLFCNALDRLVRHGIDVPPVVFLGKPSSVCGVPSLSYLQDRARQWPFTWRAIIDRDRHDAMTYLRQPGRLAVLPSRLDNLPYTALECLASGVPFLAAHTGGIPELVQADSRPQVLFELTTEALATRLAAAIVTHPHPVPPRQPFAQINAAWLRWHAVIGRRRPRRALLDSTPWVTVCVTHFNRPQHLRHALASLQRQDYPHFDVVLVDDGSDRADALAYLDDIEPAFDHAGWTLVRQPNRYLGAARNTAISHARGDYVLFMDDDNIAEPHEISTFVRAAEASGADILTCFLRVFAGNGDSSSNEGTHVWPFLGAALAPGVARNTFGDANAFVRRASFDRIGPFSEDVGIAGEDWELLARAAFRGCRLLVVPEALVRYRQSGRGMLSSTPQRANHLRALRPYFTHVPPALRGLVHLTQQAALDRSQPERAACFDHVSRAVVFGTGEAGRSAMALAARCGWQVPYFVDNNPGMWDREAHGREVRSPHALVDRDFDLVIVASISGKPDIFRQLEALGLSHRQDFVHFLEPVRVADITTQVTHP